jgi:putative membrane protein
VHPIAIVAAGIAAAIHVFFFVLESLRFSRPETWRRFNVESQRDADLLKPMAFNQGFYNLFLAIGAVSGIGAASLGHLEIGRTLVLFTCGSMALAGLVLVVTDRRLVYSALIQAGAPVIAIVGTLILQP